MKGYIYTLFADADPGVGWKLNDPIFGKVPTLGACVPNIRRVVVPGDHIFVISGRAPGVRQYVVGGFQVAEKISALAAYGRFPDLRQRFRDDGTLSGNIIVTSDGKQSPIDYHANFERRIENYIVGMNPRVIEAEREVARARGETLNILQDLFSKEGERVSDVIGRWRKVDERQIERLVGWIDTVRG
ncbi:MAG: hypothetical protein H0U97_09705 [Gammaproteobacteria bacterium]|nr:hypothetical protein [Gammaproteobacteria bacterium]